MFLLVLAIAGFSALCFADPVLVTRRYNPDRLRVAANALSIQTFRLKLTEVIERNHAWGATIALDKGGIPSLGSSSPRFGIQGWELQPETGTAMTPLPESATAH